MWRRRFKTAFLILFWLVTPDLLCLMPGMAMTVDEHKCCEQMGSECGKVPMPDMQTCCRSAPPFDVAIVAQTADYSKIRAAMLPAMPPDMDSLYGDTHSPHWLNFESPTPPLLISSDSFDILRI